MYRISEDVSIFIFTRIYMYILLTITRQKIKWKIELQRCLFRDLNLYFMTILTDVLFLKRRLLKIAVLPTGGNDNSKSRYENDLKFVMAFLNR